jgi:hypothetical protein
MEKRIPRIVGAWLAGTFDRDRAVSRAAKDGLSSFLTTDERVTQFWKKCQPQILGYASEAILETPDTLSDERSTTKEDAETKYYRVVGGSLSLILNILQKGDLEACRDEIERFLAQDSVWSLASAEDSFVRRAVFQLCQVCLQTQPDLLSAQLPRVGRALVSDALKTKQVSSAADLVRVLTDLSRRYPEVWGSKKHPLSRLQPLVEQGSQGSPAAFWQDLSQLVTVLLKEKVSSETAAIFLKSMRVGINNREEPRSNAPQAWACYVDTFQRLLASLPPDQSRVEFMQVNFYPLTDQYLFPTADNSLWTGGGRVPLLSKAWRDVASDQSTTTAASLDAEWERLGSAFVSRLSNSLPEVSQGYRESQIGISGEGERWYTLVRETIGGKDVPDLLKTAILPPSKNIIRASVDLLVRRNFKPWSAASVIQSAVKKCPYLLVDSDSNIIPTLFPSQRSEELKTLITSPSAPFLIPTLNLLGSIAEQSRDYEVAWNSLAAISIRTNLPESLGVATQLISSDVAKPLVRKNGSLQEFIVAKVLETARWDFVALKLLEAALSFDVLSDAQIHDLAVALSELLGSEVSQEAALTALEMIVRKRPSILVQPSASNLHMDLVTKLLSLTEISSTSISDKAVALRALLDKHTTGESTLVSIVQESLDQAGPDSLE